MDEVRTVSVRRATMEPDDLAQIIAMGAEMHRTSNFQDMRFDRRQFAEFVVELIAGKEHVVYVAERGGRLIGALLASVVKSYIGPDLVAHEHALFVRPEGRGSAAALRLLHAYRDWAVEQGARRINAGNSAGMDDEKYVKLLSHAGFQQAGSITYQYV